MMVLLPLLPVSAGMARYRPGFAQGVHLAEACYGLSSHSLRDATAALLKASGRWCSPGHMDGGRSSRLSLETWSMAEVGKRRRL